MEKTGENGGFLKQVVTAVVLAIGITLASVLVFAFILRVTPISEGVIKPVNQGIKLLSIFVACMISVRGEKGFLKGCLSGALATLLSILIFGLISGGAPSFIGFLIDFICGAVMGGLSGAISVNFRR